MERRENECHAMSGNETGERVRSSAEDGRCDWDVCEMLEKNTEEVHAECSPQRRRGVKGQGNERKGDGGVMSR